jgi:hypothetical protein
MAPRVYPVPASIVLGLVALFVVAAITLAWFTGDGASSVSDLNYFCPPIC